MKDEHAQFSGSIPAAYDRYLGPILFQPFKEPKPAFDGSTPVQVIERGQPDRIWRMLYYAEPGKPG
jgi:hypothetical protein